MEGQESFGVTQDTPTSTINSTSKLVLRAFGFVQYSCNDIAQDESI